MRMLRIYQYTKEDLGIEKEPIAPPDFDPKQVQYTNIPSSADVFVVPYILRELETEGVTNNYHERLPYLSGREDRHVFHNIAEDEHIRTPEGSIPFRCDCTKEVMERDPWTVSWPWPVEDFRHHVTSWAEGFTHDITFHGWVSSGILSQVLDAIEDSDYLRADVRRDKRFFGTGVPEEERPALYRSMAQAMQHSYCSLSVRSRPGVIRYRFYESMAMGRPIVHLNDGRIYPWGRFVNYEAFVFGFPEDTDPRRVANTLEQMVHAIPEAEWQLRGQAARQAWETWLNRDRWGFLRTAYVKARLGMGRLA